MVECSCGCGKVCKNRYLKGMLRKEEMVIR